MDIPVATAASSWFTRQVINRLVGARRDRLQRRRDLFQEIMGQRSAIHSCALGDGLHGHPLLGQAAVVFSGSRPVIDALQRLDEQRSSPERVRDNLLTLFKAMAHDVDMELDGNDDFILRPRSNIRA